MRFWVEISLSDRVLSCGEAGSAVVVSCVYLLSCGKLPWLGNVFIFDEMWFWPCSSSEGGFRFVPVNGIDVPSSYFSSGVGSESDTTAFGDKVDLMSDP